jgi:hypothetical protein
MHRLMAHLFQDTHQSDRPLIQLSSLMTSAVKRAAKDSSLQAYLVVVPMLLRLLYHQPMLSKSQQILLKINARHWLKLTSTTSLHLAQWHAESQEQSHTAQSSAMSS